MVTGVRCCPPRIIGAKDKVFPVVGLKHQIYSNKCILDVESPAKS